MFYMPSATLNKYALRSMLIVRVPFACVICTLPHLAIIWANDSTGYTLVEPRHIRVPFLYRHYTHAADWPAPHFALICRGSARAYPATSFFVPNCTLLLRTCTLIRREIAGNKTLPPDHGITRINKPQSTNGGIRWVAIPLILATSQATTSHIFFKPKPKLWSFGRFDHGREIQLSADGSSSSSMHSSSNKHLLRILETKQIGTKPSFLETECYCV